MTTATENQTTATPELTEEDKAKILSSLPEEMRKAVLELNSEITEYNKNVTLIQNAEKKDPKLIKAEIFEQNPDNNKKLARLLEQLRKFEEGIEKVRAEAYKVIDEDGLMPKDVSAEEIEKLKKDLPTTAKSLRDKADAFKTMEAMMPAFKVTAVIDEIKSRRGGGSSSARSAGQTGTKKLRFKKILVNGMEQETINGKTETVGVPNPDGTTKYTFTNLSKFLGKKSASITWTANDLTNAYLSSVEDENNLPDEHKFTMTHTYKNEQGNEVSVDYEITAIR